MLIEIESCVVCEDTGFIPCVEVVVCPICHGSGSFMGSPCMGCGGKGTVELDSEVDCPCCDGTA